MTLRTRLQRLLCGWHGHDALLAYEADRLFLRCASCGHESPGWEIAKAKRAAWGVAKFVSKVRRAA